MGAAQGKMRTRERETFRQILLARRAQIVGDVNQMQDSTLNKSANSNSGDLSRVPFHMADVGTDNFEHEFTLGLIENEEDELHEIDEALDRIESGDFGRCNLCHTLIAKTRLKAIPYTKLCIECKRNEETGG